MSKAIYQNKVNTDAPANTPRERRILFTSERNIIPTINKATIVDIIDNDNTLDNTYSRLEVGSIG